MSDDNRGLSRRDLLKAAVAVAASFNLAPQTVLAIARKPIKKSIPVSGEKLSLMGVGSSRTFDVRLDEIPSTELVAVLQRFFDDGGQCVDSSPMYGNAEAVIGALLKQVTGKQGLFAATKVWTDGRQNGIDQMNASMSKMGVKVVDLMQIHNLRDWRTHLQTIREWKRQGRIRYTGITTSHGRAHAELAQVLKTEQMDFVQFTYNIEDRSAEQTLFPIVRDRGIATLINVPFQRGGLFRKVKGRSLPDWAAEFDCTSWAQFFLKFVGSHPDVTCIIPATTKLKHMVDNMAAGYGRLPDAAMRKRMIEYVEKI
jgi:diketogulonate reductase-like aldo/keto reductase